MSQAYCTFKILYVTGTICSMYRIIFFTKKKNTSVKLDHSYLHVQLQICSLTRDAVFSTSLFHTTRDQHFVYHNLNPHVLRKILILFVLHSEINRGNTLLESRVNKKDMPPILRKKKNKFLTQQHTIKFEKVENHLVFLDSKY